MESLLARALESKLKYWLRSFSREQFKLQGRSVVLNNLDANGEALHSALGLPPSLAVTQARMGKLELKLPYISNVKVEPIVVDIDKLDVVLAEKADFCSPQTTGNQASSAKSSGYGFADQIADGMTIQVGTVNLMLETRGGSLDRGSPAWTPPLASITIRGLTLYTTDENWEVVSLKEARNFSADKKCIYVFKKLEWASISIDLLPHPDMFVDERLLRSSFEGSRRDSDGARRLFFGGERFLDNISGTALITMHRTEQNNPLGLEVRVLLPEAVCPALSEPGLRALLRFMTGFYVCLNRGDMRPVSHTDDSPSATLVSVAIEHIFLRINDADFRLELLAQSLHYTRASVPDANIMKTLSKLTVGGFFLRDTFSHPPCTLIQPSMLRNSDPEFSTPAFASGNLWPKIYPLVYRDESKLESPLLCLFSSQIIPSPAPPTLASQSVVQCQPLRIYLQEKSCLQIASFLADGIMLEPGVVIPDTSVKSTYISLRQLDLSVPLKADHNVQSCGSFTGAGLHVEDFVLAESPALSFRLLQLDDDPACFPLWKGQLTDSSQKKIVIRANRVTMGLETSDLGASDEQEPGLFHCIQMEEPCFEAAMVTADGSPLLTVPPPGGIVRLGMSWKQFISNTSVEQLLFVLDMYVYLGQVGRALFKADSSSKKSSKETLKRSKSMGEFIEAAPADSAFTLFLERLEVNFLESTPGQCKDQGPALVKLVGSELRFEVSHRTLGGAIAVSSTLLWHAVRIECVEADQEDAQQERVVHGQQPSMRAILWINDDDDGTKSRPFLDIRVTHMMPYKSDDAECHTLRAAAKVSGVRLGGGMIYTDSVLHRFGILGPDGGAGEELTRIMKSVSSGPLAQLLQPSHGGVEHSKWELKKPDGVEVDVEFINWLFALEGAERVAEAHREQVCWHAAFQRLRACAERRPQAGAAEPQRVVVSIEGLKAVKPMLQSAGRTAEDVVKSKGVCMDVHLVEKRSGDWSVENVCASVKEPMQMEARKDEIEHLVEVAKAEVEAASRIAVGLLQVLQLHESFGRGAIQQLSNLGSGRQKKVTELELSVSKSLELCEQLQQDPQSDKLLLLHKQLMKIQSMINHHP